MALPDSYFLVTLQDNELADLANAAGVSPSMLGRLLASDEPSISLKSLLAAQLTNLISHINGLRAPGLPKVRTSGTVVATMKLFVGDIIFAAVLTL